MKKLKKITLGIMLFILIVLISNNVKAANANITANKTYVNVGEKVTINVNINAAAWEIHVSGATSGDYADASENAENVSISKQLSFTPSAEGSYTVNLSGNVTDGTTNATTNVGETITITAKNQNSTTVDNNSNNSGNSNSSNNESQNKNTEKSNIATLSNLGIRPNDFSGFTPSKTSYSVTVPNEVESVEVYANKGQSGQTIAGTGTKKLAEGANTVNVTVTAEDGKTTKTYTINITREKEEQEDEEDEKEEENTEETVEETFGLTELNIQNVELQPQFQTDIYEYKIDLSEDIDKLDITTLATEANANIEITGNENLQEGENIITIILKGENEEKTAAYQIIVNKKVAEKLENQETPNQEENVMQEKIIIIAGIGGAILLIILIIVIVKVKKSKAKNDTYIPYGNMIDDYDEEDEEEEFYEEEPKKKKRSKGKRYK